MASQSTFLRKLLTAFGGTFTLGFKSPLAGTQVAYAIDAASSYGFVPVGGIVPWFGYNGLATVPDGWKLCDGTAISDAESPFNGQTAPNLNTAGTDPVFLGGYTSPGSVPTLVGPNLATHIHTVNSHAHTAGTLALTVGIATGAAGAATLRTTGAPATLQVLDTITGSTGNAAPNVGVPSVGDGSAHNYPNHMKVTFIIRIK